MLWRLLPVFALLAVANGGYYKVRPPRLPPGAVYYGPKPPHHYPKRHYPPPPHYRHRYPPPTYPVWKGSYLRTPVVKEAFNTPQYAPTFKDDDRGPIHTVPAPDLSLLARPGLYQSESYDDGLKKPLHSTPEDLAAVLRHGLTKVNVPHASGYQVTEDPAAASPSHSNVPSYFAPDPDPEVPALKIPPTTDPHSLPTNGQTPLDLYLQQQAEKNGQYSHYQRQVEQSNTLTPQELFNLLNYQQPSAQQQALFSLPLQTGQLYTHGQHLAEQQHLANQELVNQHLVHEEVSHRQFAQPQYQSFNYEEQGQQRLYGDLRLDLQTNGAIGLGRQKDLLLDNDVAGSEKEESYDNIVANEMRQQQRQESENDKKNEFNEIDSVKTQFFPNHLIETKPFHPNVVSNKVSNEKPVSRKEKEESQTIQRVNFPPDNISSQTMTSMKPENNVKLQKSIQIYENTYADKEEVRNINQFSNDYAEEGQVIKGTVLGIDEDKHFSKEQNVHIVDSVPYGTRIRPKRV